MSRGPRGPTSRERLRPERADVRLRAFALRRGSLRLERLPRHRGAECESESGVPSARLLRAGVEVGVGPHEP